MKNNKIKLQNQSKSCSPISDNPNQKSLEMNTNQNIRYEDQSTLIKNPNQLHVYRKYMLLPSNQTNTLNLNNNKNSLLPTSREMIYHINANNQIGNVINVANVNENPLVRSFNNDFNSRNDIIYIKSPQTSQSINSFNSIVPFINKTNPNQKRREKEKDKDKEREYMINLQKYKSKLTPRLGSLVISSVSSNKEMIKIESPSQRKSLRAGMKSIVLSKKQAQQVQSTITSSQIKTEQKNEIKNTLSYIKGSSFGSDYVISRKDRIDKGGVVDLVDMLQFSSPKQKRYIIKGGNGVKKMELTVKSKRYYVNVISHFFRKTLKKFRNFQEKLIKIQAYMKGRRIRKYIKDMIYANKVLQYFISKLNKVVFSKKSESLFEIIKNIIIQKENQLKMKKEGVQSNENDDSTLTIKNQVDCNLNEFKLTPLLNRKKEKEFQFNLDFSTVLNKILIENQNLNKIKSEFLLKLSLFSKEKTEKKEKEQKIYEEKTKHKQLRILTLLYKKNHDTLHRYYFQIWRRIVLLNGSKDNLFKNEESLRKMIMIIVKKLCNNKEMLQYKAKLLSNIRVYIRNKSLLSMIKKQEEQENESDYIKINSKDRKLRSSNRGKYNINRLFIRKYFTIWRNHMNYINNISELIKSSQIDKSSYQTNEISKLSISDNYNDIKLYNKNINNLCDSIKKTYSKTPFKNLNKISTNLLHGISPIKPTKKNFLLLKIPLLRTLYSLIIKNLYGLNKQPKSSRNNSYTFSSPIVNKLSKSILSLKTNEMIMNLLINEDFKRIYPCFYLRKWRKIVKTISLLRVNKEETYFEASKNLTPVKNRNKDEVNRLLAKEKTVFHFLKKRINKNEILSKYVNAYHMKNLLSRWRILNKSINNNYIIKNKKILCGSLIKMLIKVCSLNRKKVIDDLKKLYLSYSNKSKRLHIAENYFFKHCVLRHLRNNLVESFFLKNIEYKLKCISLKKVVENKLESFLYKNQVSKYFHILKERRRIGGSGSGSGIFSIENINTIENISKDTISACKLRQKMNNKTIYKDKLFKLVVSKFSLISNIQKAYFLKWKIANNKEKYINSVIIIQKSYKNLVNKRKERLKQLINSLYNRHIVSEITKFVEEMKRISFIISYNNKFTKILTFPYAVKLYKSLQNTKRSEKLMKLIENSEFTNRNVYLQTNFLLWRRKNSKIQKKNEILYKNLAFLTIKTKRDLEQNFNKQIFKKWRFYVILKRMSKRKLENIYKNVYDGLSQSVISMKPNENPIFHDVQRIIDRIKYIN